MKKTRPTSTLGRWLKPTLIFTAVVFVTSILGSRDCAAAPAARAPSQEARPTPEEIAKSLRSDFSGYQTYRSMAESSRTHSYRNQVAHYQATSDTFYARFLDELKDLSPGSFEMKLARAALVAEADSIDAHIASLQGVIKEYEANGRRYAAHEVREVLTVRLGDKIELQSYLTALPSDGAADVRSKMITRWQGRCEALLRLFTF